MRTMPILTKPCEGRLSERTQQSLRIRQDKVDWRVYPCEICGQSVGVLAANGDWVLDRHWPSVIYIPRRPGAGRYLAKAIIAAKLRTPPH